MTAPPRAEPRVTAATARQIRDLYDRLAPLSPPLASTAQRAASDAARSHARTHGWLPPLGWDDIDTDPDTGPQHHDELVVDPEDVDEIAIERAVAGDGIRLTHLTPAEQTEVVRRLTARGASIRDIATQLGTTTRTVSRRREQAQAA